MPEAMDQTPYAEAIVEAIPLPLLLLEPDLTVAAANPAFFRQFEVSAEKTVGRLVYELGDGHWDLPELRRLLAEVPGEQERVENYRVEHAFENLGERIMLLDARRISQGADAPDRILLAISDVTERERLIFDLEGSNEFNEKLIDSVREALVVLHWDLRVHSANQSFYDAFRVTPEETVGHPIYELGNGQWDIAALRRALEEILPQKNSFDDFEVEQEFEGIGRRIMLLNARRLDHTFLILLAIRDVTEQRQAESRQRALVGELQHRVKNILNNVRALATQTRRGRGTLEGFFEAFESRLGALTRAQDLLVQSPLEAVRLFDIVRLEMEAFGADEGRDFTAEGPVVRLSPRDAQALAMTIHELTTNAVKYGAMSAEAEAGRVEITWWTERRNGQQHLSFDWRERGVRIEDTEPARGFGLRVIEETLPYMLGGTAELTFHHEGVACRLDFPLSS